jgi:hypothetical protein
MSDGFASLNPPAHQQSTSDSERSVTVSHEDLRVVCVPWTAAHLHPEVFAVVDPYRVTNVRERNN